MRLTARAATLLVVAGLLPASARAERQPVYALTGARVITVSGPSLDSATVVLRDGLIEAVGSGLAIPADARAIDAKGLTVTPGLIDAFGGLGLPDPSAPRSAGGATRSSPPSPAAALSPQAVVLDTLRVADLMKARDTGITTALVIPADGVLPGRSALLNLSGDTVAGMVLRQPAALHLHFASLRRQYPSSLMGTLALARQALYDAVRYRDEQAAYERSPRGRKRPLYDAALEAWQDVVAGRIPLIVTARLENDVRRALTLADEFKIRVVVAGAPKASALAALIKARKLPLVVGVNFDPPKAVSFFGGDDEEKEKQDIEAAEANPAELHRAGVAFGLGSGHAKDYVAGVRKAIEKGLPAEAALRAATLGGAEALGVADRTGSLEPGKLANLVAWSGDPFAKETKARLVFVDGRLYEPAPPDKEDKKDETPSAATLAVPR
jgi:imidazolonepropionase-like amidohydrolase